MVLIHRVDEIILHEVGANERSMKMERERQRLITAHSFIMNDYSKHWAC